MGNTGRHRLIELFAKHRVAATLLMILVVLLGAFALLQLNKQFLPKFDMKMVTISVVWSGANPSDVQRAITIPIENRLHAVGSIKKISSVSSQGRSFILIEFKPHAKMTNAVQSVRNAVSLVRALPRDTLKPQVKYVKVYEPIARLVITNGGDIASLRYYVQQFKQQLLDKGIAKVRINGLAQREISIQVTPEVLASLRVSLMQLSDAIKSQSQNVAAGIVSHLMAGQQLRSTGQARSAHQFGRLPIVVGDGLDLMNLAQLATIHDQFRDYPQFIYYQGQQAVDLTLFRMGNADALHSADVMHAWLNHVKGQLPQGMHIHVYHEFWLLIQQRINLLLKNGGVGLLLILGLLYLFLNGRVAAWVAAGIPISIAAALFILLVLGYSINMITLFALIMSLGIIVDDTIVVAEESVTQFKLGKSPTEAVICGAKRMFTPIITASLTTIAAFLPLMLLGGLYGRVLIVIPIVVVCVVIASLIECFLILPFHLKTSFNSILKKEAHPLRARLDAWFINFRDHYFRRFVHAAINRTGLTLSVALLSALIAVGILLGGHLGFNFFPTPDGPMVHADVTFVSGTPTAKMNKFLEQLEAAAWQASDSLAKKENLLKTVVRFLHQGTNPYETRSDKRIGSIIVELASPADRDITNAQFIAAWHQHYKRPPWVESVQLAAPRSGPPGHDIDVGLYGGSPKVLKKAAQSLVTELARYEGVHNIADNLPYAQEELIFKLRPQAHVAGVTMQEIGDQLRAAFTGHLLQVFHEGSEEVEVRLRLDPGSRNQRASLDKLPIVISEQQTVPLGSLVEISYQKSFDSLQNLNYQLTVNVTAEIDQLQTSVSKTMASLRKDVLPQLAARYGVQYKIIGRSVEQSETLVQMKYLVLVTLGLIFIILAWVSGSYLWPFFVMIAIPLGLEGAIFGHLLLGRDLTLLSLFGFFGLTGIVINDSIILLFRYKELVDEGVENAKAIVEACCQRFRPVILTSLTTIAGLAPLLFERSLQAQFLIPMAISICFGLVFSTVLILVVIPTLVCWYHRKVPKGDADMQLD